MEVTKIRAPKVNGTPEQERRTWVDLRGRWDVASEDMTVGWTCKKRNGQTAPFDCGKIRAALRKCFESTKSPRGDDPIADRERVTESITAAVVQKLQAVDDTHPTVEHVQRLVIQQLWGRSLFDAAEHYQNWREEHRKIRERETAPIFTSRQTLKPYDYPDFLKFKDAISHSFWLVTHWNFVSDIQDFKVNLSSVERNAIRNALLAISQVEVSVKKFWTRLGDRLQKPEFEFIGVTYGESEIRHAEAYSHLLEVLGLNADFAGVLAVPAIRNRIDYLNEFLKGSTTATDRDFALSLAMFSIFTENVSLFGQFAVIKSFNRHRKVLKDVDSVVNSTAKEEALHAMLGVALINQIKAERPEWFDADFYVRVEDACRKAFRAEVGIVDWIFEAGELPFLTKKDLIVFLQHRFNEGVVSIGGKPVFEVDREALKSLQWFVEDLHADVSPDFFHKRPSDYSIGNTAITAEDLF